MDDLGMKCSDFVHALKMLICSEKHPVSRANYGYTKKLYQQHNCLQILKYSTIF